jgi:hypothetical protein
MPTKRTPLNRARKAIIDAGTLALFVELENTPMRRRHSAEFKRRDRELARRLGLGSEWFCACCSVLDRDREPCHPPGYARNDSFWMVRAVRLQLLEAAGLSEPGRARAR